MGEGSNWVWRKFQEEVIDQLVEGGGIGLVALCLGAGKTAVAVEVVRRMGARRIMVTAPLNTFGGWERHFNMFMRSEERRVGKEGRSGWSRGQYKREEK